MKAMLPGTQGRIRLEVAKQVDSYFEKKCLDYDTMNLWNLHISSGYGKDRLRKHFEDYVKNVRAMQERYGDCAADKMRKELERIGVDVEAWERELV